MNILSTYLKLKKLLKRVHDKLVLIFRTKKVLSIVVMEKTLRNITLCFQLSLNSITRISDTESHLHPDRQSSQFIVMCELQKERPAFLMCEPTNKTTPSTMMTGYKCNATCGVTSHFSQVSGSNRTNLSTINICYIYYQQI